MCWEHLLFFHVWADEIEKRTSLMRENEASLSLDQRGHVDRYAASQWFGAMADEMAGMVKAHDKLLNVSAPQSFGPPGTAGDAESIIRVATTLGSLFESMLQWVQRIRWTDIDEPFTKAGVELAKMPTLLIERVRRFPNESLLKLESAIAVRGKSGAAVKLDLTLDVGVVDTSACMAALREAERKLTWSPRVNNAQELVDQQLAALRQESERMRQHYETEATREQAEANAALSKALEELEPLRKYEGLRDAEVEVQRQLADAVKEATGLRAEAQTLLEQARIAAADERSAAEENVKDIHEQADARLDQAIRDAGRIMAEAESRQIENDSEAREKWLKREQAAADERWRKREHRLANRREQGTSALASSEDARTDAAVEQGTSQDAAPA